MSQRLQTPGAKGRPAGAAPRGGVRMSRPAAAVSFARDRVPAPAQSGQRRKAGAPGAAVPTGVSAHARGLRWRFSRMNKV